ncbi:extracellular solute-binding protein [Paenibacillus radicis (ex Xue et al. 2023)]|uniref:Extracellular solute-binding protein n=1 Tax=Paenibacillus radicis (ex Xue et al. 2023) TaxID=2972489 RepID=A0ABT1YTE5_9BACL|nr:extracellular solute-binding protein [Paenibacillus radicis (ex Xue et al. 2023)]MCR8636456.1 extracellular solute-binding protein [Paenibacillus radicis (ex Xue et al. 2023)]
MNKQSKRMLQCMTAVTLISTLTIACSKQASPVEDKAATNKSQSAAVTYPINTKQTLSYWGLMGNSAMSNFFSNIGESPFGKELNKRTGVQVNFTHPPQGQDREQFNLMVASNELPDMIETNWFNNGVYPGGSQKAINDKVIIPLNDLIKKNAPNLNKLLEEDKELAKMLQTDDGKYFVFPMVRNSFSQVFNGPMIRKDWLDELGLPVPTTIDEWETVLRAFKEKKGAAAPLSIIYSNTAGMDLKEAFIGAYKTATGFYVGDDGKVKYGPSDKQYKDVILLFRKWYNEGLLDKDFAVTDPKANNNKILSGQSGATVYLLSGGLQSYLEAMKAKDPKFNMVGTPFPTLTKGETPFIGHYEFKVEPSRGVAISANTKNPELAAQWLDYAYGKDGNELFNFGIPNESYASNNGNLTFTDKVNKDPKYTTIQMLSQYTRQNGPFMIDEKYSKMILKYPQQEEAVKLWSATDAKKHTLPSFITPTESESKELAKLTTALKSYKEEMQLKFIMGKEPIENYDKFVAQQNQLGLPKILEIYQAALDRYNKR